MVVKISTICHCEIGRLASRPGEFPNADEFSAPFGRFNSMDAGMAAGVNWRNDSARETRLCWEYGKLPWSRQQLMDRLEECSIICRV